MQLWSISDPRWLWRLSLLHHFLYTRAAVNGGWSWAKFDFKQTEAPLSPTVSSVNTYTVTFDFDNKTTSYKLTILLLSKRWKRHILHSKIVRVHLCSGQQECPVLAHHECSCCTEVPTYQPCTGLSSRNQSVRKHCVEDPNQKQPFVG